MLARPATSAWVNRSLGASLRPLAVCRSLHSGSTYRPISCNATRSHLQYEAGRSARWHGPAWHAKRTFITDALHPVLVPPTVFIGLLVALWTYKCIMTVLFQDKIIYMPYMPPFARSERIEDYAASCKPVEWREERIRSLDGTKISLCTGHIPRANKHGIREGGQTAADMDGKRKHIVICYFQGNGSSTPPRLPLLSNTLKLLQAKLPDTAFAVIALSYRSYWHSSGRASQRGIEKDAQAMLHWVQRNLFRSDNGSQLVLWGQSIGAGVASTAAATYLTQSSDNARPPIAGLVLETPFTSVASMLVALYPQKWLPYRYLSPFLWNHWDSKAALRTIAGSGEVPRVLLLPATRDEVVPAEEADKLVRLCEELRVGCERKDVVGALHHEATTRRDGQEAVARFVAGLARGRSKQDTEPSR